MILQQVKGGTLKITSVQLDTVLLDVVKHTKFSGVEDLYAEVGFGSYSVGRVVQRLKNWKKSLRSGYPRKKKRKR